MFFFQKRKTCLNDFCAKRNPDNMLEYHLWKGIFLRRYKRFFIDFEFNGNVYTGHCPNTGSMKSCLNEGFPVLFRIVHNPRRKLNFTIEMIRSQNCWIYIDTIQINSIMENFLIQHHPLLKEFNFEFLLREPKLKNFKPDFLLFNRDHLNFLEKYSLRGKKNKKIQITKSDKTKPLILEIKNVTYYLSRKDIIVFPDAQTKRGVHHLDMLISYLDSGFSCTLLFVISRCEGKYFEPDREIDQEFASRLRSFIQKGGSVIPVRLQIEVIQPEAYHLQMEAMQKYKDIFETIFTAETTYRWYEELYTVRIDLETILSFIV